MENSCARLEEKAIVLCWTEKRKSGSTEINVAVIAEKILGGWDINERILGEDMRWYKPSLTAYRRMSDYADLMAAVQEYEE